MLRNFGIASLAFLFLAALVVAPIPLQARSPSPQDASAEKPALEASDSPSEAPDASSAPEAGGEEGTPAAAASEAAADGSEDAADGSEDAAEIHWLGDYERAIAAAGELDRPILIDFGAEWCGWCKKLDRETFGDARVIRLVRDYFVPLRVDTDKSPDLGRRFDVSGLPTLVFVSSSGKEMQRFTGFMDAELFIERAGKSVASSKTLRDLREAAEANPDDIDGLRAYARALFALGNAEDARTVLDKALERKPDDAGLLLDRADVLRELGRHSEAREAFEKLIALPGERTDAEKAALYLSYGRLLVAMRDYRAAIDAFSRYLDTRSPVEGQDNSEIWEVHYWRGYAHAVLKNADSALADLRAVRDGDPGTWGLRANYIIEVVSPQG